MLRQTVRAVVIAQTGNPGACEIRVTEAAHKHASFCEFTLEKQAYCLARYYGPWVIKPARLANTRWKNKQALWSVVVKQAGLMHGTIFLSDGGKTNRPCGLQVVKQAGLTIGTLLPSAAGNTSTHSDALKLRSSLDF